MLDSQWLLNRLHRHFPNLAEQKFCIAFSGGIDSTVLLHLMATVQHEFAQLRAVHVNHQLSPDADQWARSAVNVAQACHLHCRVLRVQKTPADYESVEAFARNERYKLLYEVLEPDEWLVTAQHQDDQAETLMLQLLRGAGPQGLASMPDIGYVLKKTPVLRPMLEATRANVERYAEQHKLPWVEDPSNADDSFDRNYLRKHVMPLLRDRWPAASRVMSRSAKHCADTVSALDQYVAYDYQHVQASSHDVIKVEPLLEMDGGRLRMVVRHWIARNGFDMPSEIKLRHIISDVIQSSPDRVPLMQWGTAELRRYRNYLYLFAQDELETLAPEQLETHVLERIVKQQEPIKLALSTQEALELSWQDRLYVGQSLIDPRILQASSVELLYRPQLVSSKISETMRQVNILPWARDRVPMVVADGELVAIAGCWINPEWSADEAGIAVLWESQQRVTAHY